MKLCKDIRLGEKVSGKRFELTWKLKHNRPSGSIYVVVLPEVVPENLMEICAYEELRRKKQYGRTVIAAAANKSETIEVNRAMIEEKYQKTEDNNIKVIIDGEEVDFTRKEVALIRLAIKF